MGGGQRAVMQTSDIDGVAPSHEPLKNSRRGDISKAVGPKLAHARLGEGTASNAK